VIALCRASPTHILHAPMSFPTWSCARVCMHLLGLGALFSYSSQHGSLTIHSISQYQRKFTNPNAWDLKTKNTRAKNDRHHLYLTCHIEIMAKAGFLRQNHLSKGDIRTFMRQMWKNTICYPRFLGITRRSCLEAHRS
jgi:hypothetical protein